MVAAYGEARAKAILDENRHNTVYFPNFTVKGPIQAIRLFKPLAPNRTLAESWTFRLVGAPDLLLERTLTYSRLINAPTSIVGHDDLEMYERAQEGLHVDANPWVNIQRLYDPAEAEQDDRRHQRHLRVADAQPVPRLVQVHDAVDVTDAAMGVPTDQELDRLRHPRGAADRPAPLRGVARSVRRRWPLLDAARMGPDRSRGSPPR